MTYYFHLQYHQQKSSTMFNREPWVENDKIFCDFLSSQDVSSMPTFRLFYSGTWAYRLCGDTLGKSRISDTVDKRFPNFWTIDFRRSIDARYTLTASYMHVSQIHLSFLWTVYVFAYSMGQIQFSGFLNVHCGQFADDVTLIEPIPKQNYKMLQFDCVSKKFSDVGLKINKSKCNVKFVQRSMAPIASLDPLPVVYSEKNLWSTISNDLSLSLHFSNMLTGSMWIGSAGFD